MITPFPALRLASALAAALLATAAAPAAAQDQIRIRFAHSLSSTEPAHQAAEFFAKNVAARTNGRVQVQLFPSEQLGPGKEVNEMIRQGANVMNITDPGYLSDFVPDIGVLNGPYLIKDPADYARLLASDWYKGVEKRLEQAGFKLVMANGFFGQRHLIADKAAQNFGLDPVGVLSALLEREQSGSTGLGRGVATPHARVSGLEHSRLVVVRLEQPIAFGAIDGQPVDLFFALLSPEDSGVEHLRALARISRLVRREDLRGQLRQAADADAIRFLLAQGEATAA
jgi:mannitol/fructose-specific phosphotransferase system IIA component (Ntr-type)